MGVLWWLKKGSTRKNRKESAIFQNAIGEKKDRQESQLLRKILKETFNSPDAVTVLYPLDNPPLNENEELTIKKIDYKNGYMKISIGDYRATIIPESLDTLARAEEELLSQDITIPEEGTASNVSQHAITAKTLQEEEFYGSIAIKQSTEEPKIESTQYSPPSQKKRDEKTQNEMAKDAVRPPPSCCKAKYQKVQSPPDTRILS
ncbi:hypothetical protein N8772_03765 [Rickettsiales bacterium]|nr:hypothetical protein [Rickettsiales bacterium]MDB2550557.1 hypothetical protein [Rickettsiales bacterium]